MVNLSAFDLAQRFVGVKEAPGVASNPLVVSMLQLDAAWVKDDVTPWCSAFANYVAWLLRLPRSKSLGARSWLTVGRPVAIEQARADADVVILKRGTGDQPGPDVIAAAGHVGFYAGVQGDNVLVLGGNQGDAVSIAPFPQSHILGIRRLQ
jgi:uncharacterized protein (TIGR02594 family)